VAYRVQRRVQDFSFGSKTERPKIEAEGRERGEAASPSPPARKSGERCELPSGVRGRSPDSPKVIPLFSALNYSVDYYAAGGEGKTPSPLRIYAPYLVPLSDICGNRAIVRETRILHPRYISPPLKVLAYKKTTDKMSTAADRHHALW